MESSEGNDSVERGKSAEQIAQSVANAVVESVRTDPHILFAVGGIGKILGAEASANERAVGYKMALADVRTDGRLSMSPRDTTAYIDQRDLGFFDRYKNQRGYWEPIIYSGPTPDKNAFPDRLWILWNEKIGKSAYESPLMTDHRSGRSFTLAISGPKDKKEIEEIKSEDLKQLFRDVADGKKLDLRMLDKVFFRLGMTFIPEYYKEMLHLAHEALDEK